MHPTKAYPSFEDAKALDETGIELLSACLAIAPTTGETMRLRVRLLSDVAVWERLFEAASALRLMPALAVRLRARGLVPPQARQNDLDRLTPSSILDAQWADHLSIRARQAVSLANVITILSGLAIQPTLIKGAHCLWAETDCWRTMRDLDILVPGARAREANEALMAEGYLPLPDAVHRPNRHHLDLLFRHDLPGWVEIHRRAGNPYAEQFLRTAEIAARSVLMEHPAGRARILPAAVHIWHSLVHHHFGHSGFARGTVDLKGLFEFAMAVSALPAKDVERLVALASRDAAGLAAFDLWVAAAVDLFAMPLPTGVSLPEDAVAAWQKIGRRNRGQAAGPKHRGYFEFILLGWARERARRVRPKPALGAIGARCRVVERLLPKLRRN
jgi:hypothetical protein